MCGLSKVLGANTKSQFWGRKDHDSLVYIEWVKQNKIANVLTVRRVNKGLSITIFVNVNVLERQHQYDSNMHYCLFDL